MSGEVVLAVGASHSTLMNTHWDSTEDKESAEAFRSALGRAQAEVAAVKPDVIVCVGTNHFRGLFLDMMPAFTIGVGEVIGSGEAKTLAGPLPVDIELARHLAVSLVDDEFDVAFSLRLQVDHGITHSYEMLSPSTDIPVVPILVNAFAPPLPLLRRCGDFGRAVGRAIGKYDKDVRVAIIASGGLSHQLPWPVWDRPESDDEAFLVEAWLNGRASWTEYEGRRREIVLKALSRLNPEFDKHFLELVAEGRLEEIERYSTEQLVEAAGNGGQEIRTWLIAAAAAGNRAGSVLGYWPMDEWLTGMGVALLSPAAVAPTIA